MKLRGVFIMERDTKLTIAPPPQACRLTRHI